MAKIIIPERDKKVITQRNELEINVEEGDLVLVTNALNFEHDVRKAANLGVFQSKERDNQGYERINLGNYYCLKRCIKFGRIYLPIVETKCGTIRISSFLREFYAGQDEIVKALQSWSGFEPHAEWIARLEKPYIKGEETSE